MFYHDLWFPHTKANPRFMRTMKYSKKLKSWPRLCDVTHSSEIIQNINPLDVGSVVHSVPCGSGWVWSELSHLLFDILKCCRLWPDKSAGWVHHRWDIDETPALAGSWSIILFIFIQNSVENNIIGRSMIGRIWKKQRKKKQQVCFCCTRFFLQKRSNLSQNK